MTLQSQHAPVMSMFSAPRLDRALTIGFVHPISRFLDRGSRVPILMYHSICDASGEKHPYFETNTSQRVFAQQMSFLNEVGYKTADISQALASIDDDSDCKRVVITFDDGYR